MTTFIIFCIQWTNARLNLCIVLENYESETRDAQVDRSLEGIGFLGGGGGVCEAKKFKEVYKA